MKDIDTLVRTNKAYFEGATTHKNGGSRLNPYVEAQELYRQAWFNGYDDSQMKDLKV